MAPLKIIEQFIPVVCALVCAPLLNGIINRVKALVAGRQGQPLLQSYFDIIKQMRRGAVFSRSVSGWFGLGPVIGFAAILTALCIIPLGIIAAPISFRGDILLFCGVLALARFAYIIAALDTASAFEGMGASREAWLGALSEPVLLLCFLSLAHQSQSLFSGEIFGVSTGYPFLLELFCALALFVLLLVENARMPVDDPNTHLELTMIHEVMVLDHSGPDLGIITYGAALKLWLFATIIVQIVKPWHPQNPMMNIALIIGGNFLIAIIIGAVESFMARLRLVRIPQLIALALALALAGLLVGSGWIL